MNASLPRVGIFDADAPPALAFTRSLGRAGVPLRVYSPRRFPVARYSKHCAAFSRCPDPEDHARFLPFLVEELRSGRIDLVAPTSDLLAFHLAGAHEALAPALRERLPRPEAIFDSLFKDRFDAACARAGFRTPWAAHPLSVEQARDEAATYRYPAVLKPKSHVGVGLERGLVVHDAAELRRAFLPYAVPPGGAPACARFPSLSLPMVQEYVPGTLANLYSVSGVLDGGRAVALCASHKAAQWPPTLGIGIEFHCCADEELVARGAALAGALLARGLFEVEFIRDPRDGGLLAIDLNPRAHGFISFDLARGNDLPLYWYRLATGERVAPAPPAREDLVWTHAIPWTARRLAQRLRGLPRAPRPRNAVDIVHDREDLLPSLGFAALMLRHPGGLLRPFFKEPGEDARKPAAPALLPG